MLDRLRKKRTSREELNAQAWLDIQQLLSQYAAEQGYPAYDPTIHVLR